MILRLWRGWATPGNADRYEELISSTIFPGIAARRIDGFEEIELHRRRSGDEAEFMTLMRFSLPAHQTVRGRAHYELREARAASA